MPQEIMTPRYLPSLLPRNNDLVAQSVVEDVAGGLNVHPLLPVRRRHLVEFGPVEGDGRILRVVEHDVIDGGAEVEETGCLC